MEDEQEVRKMIEDPNVQWILYQDNSYNIAGCITFVLDFEYKRGYIRGFMLKKKYQGYIDITKAMIGSMLGMLHKFKGKIYTWYVENRTAHAKSQYSMWVCGIAPIAFYPNKDIFLGKVAPICSRQISSQFSRFLKLLAFVMSYTSINP